MVAADIANNSYGYIITAGRLEGIDTSHLSIGQFFTGITDGATQTAAPVYPNFPMCLGFVVRSDATNGVVFLAQQNHSIKSFRVQMDQHIGGSLTIDGDLNVTGSTNTTSTSDVTAGAPFYRANEGDAIGDANTTFTGSGLDDAFFAGHFTGTTSTNYYVKIDGVGTPDTFAVSTDNFSTTISTGNAITGSEQMIHSADNISVKFGATTGHTLNDVWTGTASPVNVDTGFFSNRNTGTSGVGYTHMGLFYDASESKWRLVDEYDPVPAGTIDTAHSSYVAGTIAANVEGNVTGNITGNVAGNAATASALESARTIGGVSFDGTANINLAGVNTTGNQDTTGNAATATALENARTIQVSGDVTGSASFDGTANINITTTVQDDSHAHVISNVDGLQSALDAKVPTSRIITAGNGLTGGGNLTANRTLAIDSSYTGFDSRYVNVTGDTITGVLTLGSNPSNAGELRVNDTSTTAYTVAFKGTGTRGYAFEGSSSGGDYNTTFSNAGTGNHNVTINGHLGIGGTATDTAWNDAAFGNTEVSIDGGGGYGVLHFRGDGAGSTNTRYSIGVGDSIFYMAYDDVDGVHRVKLNSSHQLIVNETSGGAGDRRVFHDGYHPNADKWTTARTLSLSGDASGSVSWDGSANATLSVSNVDAETLDGKDHTRFGATLATYGTTSGTSGRIRCTAPFATNSAHMFQVTISIYSSYTVHTYVVGGYMYPSTNQWYSSKCVYTGTGNPDIVVGRDTNGKAYISIANGSYTGVRVHNMTLGYQTNVADTYDPWTISINGATENSVTPTVSKVWHSTNDGSGSGLDADLLDGVQGNKYFTSYNNAGTTGWEDTNRNFRINSGGNAVGFAMHESDGTFGFQLYGDGTNYGFLDANWGSWDIQKAINGAFKVDEGSGLQRVFNDAYHPNADTLTTARTINGVSFNGSANITVADSTKLPLSGGTMTGELQVNARLDVGNGTNASHEIRIYKADNNVSDHIQFYNGTTRMGEIGVQDTTWLRFNQVTNKNLYTPRAFRIDGGLLQPSVIAYHDGDTNTYIQFHAADQWRVVTGGTERLEVNNTNTTVTNDLRNNDFRNQSSIRRNTLNAWLTFNGTGTPSIRDDEGVTSVSDLGTGKYRANFSITMPAGNYTLTAAAAGGDESVIYWSNATTPSPYSTTQMQITVQDSNSGGHRDSSYVWCQWASDAA